MKRALLAAAAAGCGSLPPPAAAPISGTAPPPRACRERVLGKENAEAVSVAVTADAVVWQNYNFGQLRIRMLDGDRPTTTLSEWPEEHLTEDLLVHTRYAYWTSKAEHAMFRVALAGGKAEKLIGVAGGESPTRIANVGDTIYAATLGDKLLWWQPGGKSNVIVISDLGLAGFGWHGLAGGDDGLYIGTDGGIVRLRSPESKAELVLTSDHPVAAVAVSATMLYWVETKFTAQGVDVARVERRSRGGGSASVIEEGGPYDFLGLVAGNAGVYILRGNAILWVADDATESVDVAETPAAVTDLAVLGDSLIVGSADGFVREMCPRPEAAGARDGAAR